MAKMSYGEQLKHPNWQRLRLERLEAAGWKCQACGDKETTLHVHHKQYAKGRMAWDYPAENFAVLCEPCHAQAHTISEEMAALLAHVGHRSISAAIPMLAGWFGYAVSGNVLQPLIDKDTRLAAVGEMAFMFRVADLDKHAISLMAEASADAQFLSDLRTALDSYKERDQLAKAAGGDPPGEGQPT
jgi:hypothetical protein